MVVCAFCEHPAHHARCDVPIPQGEAACSSPCGCIAKSGTIEWHMYVSGKQSIAERNRQEQARRLREQAESLTYRGVQFFNQDVTLGNPPTESYRVNPPPGTVTASNGESVTLADAATELLGQRVVADMERRARVEAESAALRNASYRFWQTPATGTTTPASDIQNMLNTLASSPSEEISLLRSRIGQLQTRISQLQNENSRLRRMIDHTPADRRSQMWRAEAERQVRDAVARTDLAAGTESPSAEANVNEISRDPNSTTDDNDIAF